LSKKLNLNRNEKKTWGIDFPFRSGISSIQSGTHGMTKSSNQKHHQPQAIDRKGCRLERILGLVRPSLCERYMVEKLSQILRAFFERPQDCVTFQKRL
jgi:hypothetical protein